MRRAVGSIGDTWRDQGCLGQALLILLLSVLVGVPCGVLSIIVYPPAPLSTATQPAPLTATARSAPTAAPTCTASSAGVSATPSRETAQVLRVLTGDSIEVSIGSRVFQVRYMGIEAPDVFGWAGQQALAFNERLVAGKTVDLEGGTHDTDRFQRLLRYVYVGDLFVNAELLRMGHARVATDAPEVKHQELFAGLERKAREMGRGLWAVTATATPTPLPTATSKPLPTVTMTAQSAPTGPASQAEANVVISFIFFQGDKSRAESNEYAEILNLGESAVNLKGWRLNAGNSRQDFWFPDYVLESRQACRVYTNELHAESGGFSFGSGRAIWYNSSDCGYLYDAAGTRVDEYCY